MAKPESWHIDFETFSNIDITESGSFRYSEDPTTEALILGFSSDSNPTPQVVDLTAPGALERLAPLFAGITRGDIIKAHNVTFERNIWTNVCKFPVTPKDHQWGCTAARARVIAIPGSLDGASKALGAKSHKGESGKGLIGIFSKPVKGQRIRSTDRPDDFKRFMEYCGQDVIVEQELDTILPELSQEEHAAFLLDYKINQAGMPVNMMAVDRASDFVDEYSEVLLKRAIEISGVKPSQREKTLAFLKSRGFELPNLQAATVEALAAQSGLPPEIQELLDVRIEISRAGTKKLKAIKNSVSADGRIRGGFMFSAATTRRWSSVGVQMHNLQKPSGESNPELLLGLLEDDLPSEIPLLFSRPMTAIAQSIRGFFESNQTLMVADYASVEPRGLAWAAEEEWLLEAYRKKQDAYKIAAGRVYGVPPELVDSHQRFMGKQLILGAGYGMGPPRFAETVAGFGRIIALDQAQVAIRDYRASVPSIVAFWKGVEKAAVKATKFWKTVSYNRFVFRPDTLPNGFPILYIDMPSGTIAYPLPMVAQEEWAGGTNDCFEYHAPRGGSFCKTSTFGGSLTENICQALTRDILRDGMIAADRDGFNLIGHCHDEAIAEGDYNKNDLKDFEHVLCNSSPWAEGFPIASEGYLAKRYKK